MVLNVTRARRRRAPTRAEGAGRRPRGAAEKQKRSTKSVAQSHPKIICIIPPHADAQKKSGFFSGPGLGRCNSISAARNQNVHGWFARRAPRPSATFPEFRVNRTDEGPNQLSHVQVENTCPFLVQNTCSFLVQNAIPFLVQTTIPKNVKNVSPNVAKNGIHKLSKRSIMRCTKSHP